MFVYNVVRVYNLYTFLYDQQYVYWENEREKKSTVEVSHFKPRRYLTDINLLCL